MNSQPLPLLSPSAHAPSYGAAEPRAPPTAHPRAASAVCAAAVALLLVALLHGAPRPHARLQLFSTAAATQRSVAQVAVWAAPASRLQAEAVQEPSSAAPPLPGHRDTPRRYAGSMDSGRLEIEKAPLWQEAAVFLVLGAGAYFAFLSAFTASDRLSGVAFGVGSLIALFRPDSPDATDAKEQRENNGVAMLVVLPNPFPRPLLRVTGPESPPPSPHPFGPFPTSDAVAVSSEKDKDDEVETRSSKKSLNMGFLDGIDLSGTVGEAGFKEKAQELPSIASLTRAEWEEKYEKDGKVSLWMEDEFNAGSRLVGAKEDYGKGTGEKSLGNAPVHKVKLTDRDGTIYDLEVPEDQYILWHAEEKGMKLPFACRVGCCTTCAVRIKKGVLVQEQALGIAPQYRQAGYGLMCVAFAKSDLEMELIEEDELYDLQFGDFFNQLATNPNAPNILRDDFALEIADMDE